VVGLETALVCLYSERIRAGQLQWGTLVRLLSDAPRKRLRLEPLRIEEGHPFEAVLFNPNAETTITRDHLRSRSFNSPWLGQTLAGQVEQVFFDGQALLA
jgi:dihydroorotase